MTEKTSKSIFILGTLFFVFGFVTWLNGTLIPYLKIACQLSNFQSYLVTFAFYISYFVMALPSSAVLKKTGYKKGMVLGLLIMAVGALVFIPAAQSRTYYLFLSGLFIIGSGLALLQTASNPYITIIGPLETAAKRISIMGICNKIAGTLAPIILGAVILNNVDTLSTQLEIADADTKNLLLNELASRVIMPYGIMALLLVLLAAMVYFSSLPELELSEKDQESAEATKDKKSIWQFSHLLLGVIALFLYVGAEVIAGDTIGNYGIFNHIPIDEAKNFTSYTLSSMVIGYILGIILIPKYIKQEKALAISAILGIILSVCILFTHGYLSVLCVALLGLANALVWPAIWPLAIKGLGSFTKMGSSMLIMSIAGGALLPLLYGKIADLSNQQSAYWILIPCYAFILHYSLIGNKIKK